MHTEARTHETDRRKNRVKRSRYCWVSDFKQFLNQTAVNPYHPLTHPHIDEQTHTHDYRHNGQEKHLAKDF